MIRYSVFNVHSVCDLSCKHDAHNAFLFGMTHCHRGDGEIRTHDPLLARQVLSQLSYTPIMDFIHIFIF